MSEQETQLFKFGVSFPKEFVKEIDNAKGFHSRNKFILKVLMENLDNYKQDNKREVNA